MRITAFVLLILIGLLTYDIFQGKNGIAQYEEVLEQLKEAKEISLKLAARNNAIKDEIKDLEQGQVAVEELARTELGLIKPDEIFYRVINPAQNKQ